jgi:hypothetical protein
MLIQILWLLIILSFEATLGLPLFFLHLSAAILLGRLSERAALMAVFGVSLLLAIFYNLSWPLTSALLLAWYFAKLVLVKQPLALLALFAILQLIFFFMASLSWHYFYLLHLAIFLWYFAKNNLRTYSRKYAP